MVNLFSLENKRAVVTGGLGLIGKAIAMNLFKTGSETIILDINDELGREFLNKVNTSNSRMFFEHFDITKLEKIAKNITNIEKKYGTIDTVSYTHLTLPTTPYV